ncbi:Protein-export membrane protein SecG [Paracoccus marcusii]|uniref:preprotein translocase subunit SecG n=1 Tax=Paracoccus marcusii TaxID=59779 RepID=UPI001C3C7D15|nr:preprotein translocase subunit SecG [Paracoccus marcusii]QXI62819.1 Protein-export membrane protein SecG [Paracoccus marcusii]
MENVILTVHLILAVMLAGVVLLQRSEGGGLGMGGGGGAGGGVMSGRQAANVLTRVTWILGVAIFATSIALTILAARQANNSSIMDQFGGQAPTEAPATGLPGLPAYTPPPSTAGNPLTPPSPDAATDAPATQAPATDAPATDAAVTPAPATQTPAEAPADALTPPAPEAPAPAAAAPAAAPDAAAEPATPDTAPAPAN